jgi:hypothetical protein
LKNKTNLSDGQIRRYEVFLFVEISNPGFGCFLHNDRDAVGIFPADFFTFGTALLVRVLFL